MNSCTILAGVFITLGWFTKVVPTGAMVFHDLNSKRSCLPGYSGDRCRQACQYPKFGLQCKGMCDCKQTLCHYITGCPPLAAICQAGVIGKYCDEQCEFPMYGYGCQQRCLCSKTRCSISNGCSKIKSKKGIIHQYVTTKSSFALMEKTTSTGSVKEFHGKPMVDNELSTGKGFTAKTLLHTHRVNEPTKDEQMENTLLEQPSQTSKITWIHTVIISVGGMLAVVVIAHIVISINNCVNGMRRATY